MPRVNSVQKARKAQGTCGRCGAAIDVGDAYLWIKPRYGGKRVRCSKPECRFRSSDLTGGKMAGVYAAQENVEDSIGDCASIDDLKSLAEDTADSIEEVGNEYQESADNIREHFETSDTADECEEKAEGLLEWAETIRSSLEDFGDFEPAEPDEVECPNCGEQMTQNTEGRWDCPDEDCDTKDHDPTEDPDFEGRDDNGRTEEEYVDEARQALEDAVSDCPL